MHMGPRKVIWIAGASGRVGQAVERLLDHGDYVIITTDTELDVTDHEAVLQYVAVNRPNIVINCAAMTDEAACEAHPVEAYRVNAMGARNLAAAAWSVGASIVQLTCDDVFADQGGERNEFDATPPRESVCAKSKIAGENFVRELNPKHVIVRSDWIYGAEPGYWLDSLLMAARTGAPFAVTTDQLASPTSVTTLAACIVALIESEEYGLFHAADRGVTSRYDFAREVLRLAGLSESCLVPESDPAAARTVRLANLMLTMTGVFTMPAWQDDLRTYLAAQDLLVR